MKQLIIEKCSLIKDLGDLRNDPDFKHISNFEDQINALKYIRELDEAKKLDATFSFIILHELFDQKGFIELIKRVYFYR